MRSWVLQNTNYLSVACIELRQSLRLQTREAFDFSRGRLHFNQPVTAVFPMENLVAFEIVFVSVVKKVAPKCIGVNTEITDI